MVCWACALVIIPIPFFADFLHFGLFIWVLLFLGASMMPSLTGLMLNSVESHLRGSANSFSQFWFNGMGWLPAPILYGLISTIVQKDKMNKHSHIPLTVTLYLGLIPMLLITVLIRHKQHQNNQELQLSKSSQFLQEKETAKAQANTNEDRHAEEDQQHLIHQEKESDYDLDYTSNDSEFDLLRVDLCESVDSRTT